VIIGSSENWLLATGFFPDDKGIIACDPITGRYVLLAHDASTGTVGGVRSIFVPGARAWLAIADAGAIKVAGEITLPDSAVRRLQAFAPAVYLSVTLK
jgi:hypothetical protein